MLQGAMKSKTMWTAAITAMLGTAITTMPVLQESIPKDTYGYILMGLSLVFAWLRVVTTRPLIAK